MLVCVKTLVDVVSFEDVRNSKEWLTTRETWQYIADNSIMAFHLISGYVRGSMWEYDFFSTEDYEKKEEEYKKIISELNDWRVPYSNIYAMIDHVTVKDNAGTSIKFYNIATIREYIERQEARKAKVKEKIKYRETRLSFYDPEWFMMQNGLTD